MVESEFSTPLVHSFDDDPEQHDQNGSAHAGNDTAVVAGLLLPVRKHDNLIGESNLEDNNDLSIASGNDICEAVSLPRKRCSTMILLKEASAAAVAAAEANQDTDSVLSYDGHEVDATEQQKKSFRVPSPPPNLEDFRRMSEATFQFIQEASIERALSSNQQRKNETNLDVGDADTENDERPDELLESDDHSFTDMRQSWDEVLVENSSLEASSVEDVISMNESFSERGLFSEFQQDSRYADRRQSQLSISSASSAVDHINDDTSIDSTPSLRGGAVSEAGQASKSAREILLSADVINGDDIQYLDDLQRQQQFKGSYSPQSTVHNSLDDDALLLHLVFEGFTTPSLSLESICDILELEQNQNYDSCINGKGSVPLPKDCVVRVVEKSRVLSVILCRNHQVLLQLPKVFFLAFFRILIRLLTNETDGEYNKKTMLTCDWREAQSEHARQRQQHQGLGDEKSDKSFRLRPSSSSGNENFESAGYKPVRPSLSLTEDRRGDHNSRKANQIYTVTRLQQCGTTSGDDKYAARKLLRLFDLIKSQKQFRYLLAPLARLLGLICTAGVSARVLRRLLSLASSPVTASSQVPPVARLLLVRALQTATESASRSFLMMGKATLRHFFSFGSGKGLSRNISGLASWPFRNDFGFTAWFRAETFYNKDSKNPVLLSVRAEDGGGIEVSLVPLDEEKGSDSDPPSAAALSISIFDSDPDGLEEIEVQRLRVPGCILLPRVWYHVAVRHTRSRLKGVFSLSTRQQVSIMLDGKTMLTEPLKFPKVTDDEFQSENKAAVFLQRAVRRSTSRTGLSLNVTFGGNFDGQTGALYLFHENVSDATLRAIYEVSAGTAGTVKKASDRTSGWDSRRGDIVRKSRLLDVSIKKDDAEEIVLSQRRQSTGDLAHDAVPRSSGALSVIDFGEGEEQEFSDELPADLSKTAFSSKLFLVWDPSRTEASMALELHIGAHVKMAEVGVQAWQLDGAQDVISSIGGVQALIPLFQTLLCGDIERTWFDTEDEENAEFPESYDSSGTFSRDGLWSMIPDLLFLMASFVRDHGENARELLRCGGVDVIESFILASKKAALSKPRPETNSVFGPLTAFPALSRLLVESLLRLLSACSHYIGLETKMFSRLFFNIPLWFSGVNQVLGVSLDVTLLPVLSATARGNPGKVLDCVGVKDMVFLLKEYVSVEKTEVRPLLVLI
jgi:hypothetical protein